MIRSFADAETEHIWLGLRSRRLPHSIQRVARRKLRMIDAALALGELRNPPGNRLEKLAGNRAGQWSIRMTNGASASPGVPKEPSMSKSSITTETNKRAKLLPNIHPGEILLEEFLKPLRMSQNALAREIGVPPRRINEIILRKRSVSADTDLRLARYFGMSEGFFLRLQIAYDLEEVRRRLQSTLRRITPRAA